MLVIRESRRLKQEATEVATNPIQDSRANLLEEGGNDTVQPCDTTQARSDSDFDIKYATVQVYSNNHNSQSDHWIGLNVYMASPDMLSYLKFQVIQSSGRHGNTGQYRLYEFCYLLPSDCGLPIWLGFFSYKDVAAGFENFEEDVDDI